MRLSEPRVPPKTDDELTPDEQEQLQRAGIGDGPIFNIFRTLVHHPDLMQRWLPFGNHILFRNSLQAREREIVILRIGWLCNAEYEWGQHCVIGERAGLSREDFARIADGPDAAAWSAADRALLRATDELHSDAFVSDATWSELTSHFDTKQLLDLVFTVGQYNMVSMALNTFGVQLDEGIPTFEATAGRRPDATTPTS